MEGVRQAQLPEHIEKMRTRVGVKFKKVHNPTGSFGARTYASLGFDNSLNIDHFRANSTVDISYCTHEEVTFDVIKVDAPIVNALRRILLVEVPTIAVELVDFHDNTSIMHDEMLAHRLGLVPLKIDPRPFDIWKKGEPHTSRNTIKFSLKVRCEQNRLAPTDSEAPPDVLYKNHKVLTSHIEHVPFPGAEAQQAAMFGDQPPAPVHDDILLCKLRPGQQIHVEMDATKNIGKEHAKWSPVCTAAYRMLPEVQLRQPVHGEDAETLVNMCPAKVFDIEDEAAIVARPRDCTMCRECIRLPEWDERVELSRKRDHFIFNIESTGALPASTLVSEALSVLMTKCDTVLEGLEVALRDRSDLQAQGNEDVDMALGNA